MLKPSPLKHKERDINAHRLSSSYASHDAWHDKYKEIEEKFDELRSDQTTLGSENKQLTVTIKECRDEISKLKVEVSRWKKLSEELPDSELVEELENESKQQRREIRKRLSVRGGRRANPVEPNSRTTTSSPATTATTTATAATAPVASFPAAAAVAGGRQSMGHSVVR